MFYYLPKVCSKYIYMYLLIVVFFVLFFIKQLF